MFDRWAVTLVWLCFAHEPPQWQQRQPLERFVVSTAGRRNTEHVFKSDGFSGESKRSSASTESCDMIAVVAVDWLTAVQHRHKRPKIQKKGQMKSDRSSWCTFASSLVRSHLQFHTRSLIRSGNNNSYCHSDAIFFFHWATWMQDRFNCLEIQMFSLCFDPLPPLIDPVAAAALSSTGRDLDWTLPDSATWVLDRLKRPGIQMIQPLWVDKFNHWHLATSSTQFHWKHT